ncbi:uncharacterized protein LOC107368167 [Tetranychus urticae]|uniref:Lipocalin/cytosolic fatty-acid binding domain-containing protein n=1 Tax=Tetranychus urticae TaxID=32264 RepID=T1JU66_TETUR|nr:uncharacterized protein LOC107368167 [Tetranychus urticae]
MKIYVSVFVLSVLVAVGQCTKIDGPCPIKIKQIETFDVNRYLGKWWDVYAGSNSYGSCGSGYGCILTYYRLYHEDTHAIPINYFSGPDYANICSVGIWQTDYDVDGRLFYDGDDNSIYVLDTDYDSYAVEIACSNDDGTTHEEKVVFRSRNMTMSAEVRDKLVKKVVDYGFAEPELVAHNFTGCKDFDPDFWHKH